MVRLPKPMDLDSTSNLVLETVQTHATRPWPAKAAQDEDQKLKYDMTLFVLSPYRTVVQRTKIRYAPIAIAGALISVLKRQSPGHLHHAFIRTQRPPMSTSSRQAPP
jgi:hypothetical protein